MKHSPFPSSGPPPLGEVTDFQLHLRKQISLLTELARARNESCVHTPSSAFIPSSTEAFVPSAVEPVLEHRQRDPGVETWLLPCWSGGSYSLATACPGLSWFIESFTEFTFEWAHGQTVARKSTSTSWTVKSFICLRHQRPASHHVCLGLPAFCGCLFSPGSAVIPGLLGSLLVGLSPQAGGFSHRRSFQQSRTWSLAVTFTFPKSRMNRSHSGGT